jgi:dTDP-4-amino-4,6-dideoxygalactose transaminase
MKSTTSSDPISRVPNGSSLREPRRSWRFTISGSGRMWSIYGIFVSHEIYYIEDNAHGFLSTTASRPLGTFGDIAIFSQRKTVALPNGGALVINLPSLQTRSQELHSNIPIRSRVATDITFLLRNLVLSVDFLPGVDTASLLRKLIRLHSLRRFSHRGLHTATQDGANEAYSKLASWILLRVDLEREKQTRRKGYLFWRNVFENCKARDLTVVFRELADGVVPLGFPIRVRRRKRLVEELNKQRIRCYAWPTPPSTAPRNPINQEIAVVPLNRCPPASQEDIISQALKSLVS